MATLVYNPGEADESCFSIRDAAVSIGRAEDQGICIPHKSLSRSHARIEPSGSRFFVVDLESKNGTLVNGVRVQRHELHHGDTVTLGNLDLLFRLDSDSAGEGRAPGEPQPQATRALLRGPLSRLARDAGGAREAVGRTQGRLRTLIEVTKLLPLSDDTDALLGKILDLVFQILEVDRGVILLVDEKTGELEPRAVRTVHIGHAVSHHPDHDAGARARAAGAQGLPPSVEGPPTYSQNIVQYVLRKSVAALFTDAGTDPRLDSARSVVVQSIRASMCVPLKPKDDVIGVLYVDSQRSASLFTEEDLEFLLAFASQAAVAIENARLYRRLELETVARMQLTMEAKLASLGAMVAAIAHELRNPLNFMTNFAELSVGLTDEVEGALSPYAGALPDDTQADLTDAIASLRGNVSRIREHGRRADAIIQGMLQHTRRPSGVRELADLNAIVAEGVRMGRDGVQGKGFEVRLVEAVRPGARADGGRRARPRPRLPQRGGERALRHAPEAARSRRGVRARAAGAHRGPRRPDRGAHPRQRDGDPRRRRGAGLRALLHDEAGGAGDGPRPLAEPRDRRAGAPGHDARGVVRGGVDRDRVLVAEGPLSAG